MSDIGKLDHGAAMVSRYRFVDLVAAVVLSNLVMATLCVTIINSARPRSAEPMASTSVPQFEATSDSLLGKQMRQGTFSQATPHSLYAGSVSTPVNDASLAPTPADLSDFVEKVSHGRLQFLAETTAPNNLVAVTMAIAGNQRNDRLIGYVLPGENGLLIGTLLNKEGDNVTAEIAQKLTFPGSQTGTPVAPPVAQSASQGVGGFRSLVKPFDLSYYHAILEGNGPTHLTIFVDPNCSACNLLWHELHAVPDYQRRFTLQWIPVGVIKPTSVGVAAALLKSGTVAALDEDESQFDHVAELGGVSPITDTLLANEVQNNNENWAKLLIQNGLPAATPSVILDAKQITIGVPPQSFFNALALGIRR
jgi:hypothetical protein